MPKMYKIVANRIAKKRNTFDYNGVRPDIFDFPIVVDLVMVHGVEKGFQKFNDFEEPTYIAGAAPLTVERTNKVTRGTSLGVMNQFGEIVK